MFSLCGSVLLRWSCLSCPVLEFLSYPVDTSFYVSFHISGYQFEDVVCGVDRDSDEFLKPDSHVLLYYFLVSRGETRI
jgi:hypothetical protein